MAPAETLIAARAQGAPLRAIATIYRRNPLVYFAKVDSGITRPQDFIGKTIRASAFQMAVLHAMTARVGIPPDRYAVTCCDLALFYSDHAQVSEGYLTNEVLAAQKAGYKLNIIFPDDYGVHFYADTLFATDDFLATKPDLVRRFLRATLKGWTYAVQNPMAIGPLVGAYKPDADAAFETAKMIASLPLINTGEDHIGWMKPEVWAGMERTLRKLNLLKAPVDVTQVYTLQFLHEIYGQ